MENIATKQMKMLVKMLDIYSNFMPLEKDMIILINFIKILLIVKKHFLEE